jgi:probable HAF family extracellular repeat protein
MRPLIPLVLLAAVYGCGTDPDSDASAPLAANTQATTAPAYRVTKLAVDLGGTQSRGMAINASRWVAGWSNLADGSRHAALWRHGRLTDLGTLGGPSSTVPWPGLNDEGMVVGVSHTARPDPLHEDWSCDAGGFLPEATDLICRGFVWQNGRMLELPTLGGHHGFAAGVNNHGEIVGWAETARRDPTCVDAQVLGFRAVVWRLKPGWITRRQLRPYHGDSASAATAINDRGQVVGISGDCDQAVGRFSARHAVWWDASGRVHRMPDLGGTTWHTPMDVNGDGDVAGFSNPPGAGDPQGDFIAHAFLWRRGAGKARDLGTLQGDALSEAFALNIHRQVVGVSFGGAAGSRAFLWQKGRMHDLNQLVDIKPDVLLSAQDINDEGRITGRVLDGTTGRIHVFVASPSGGQ